MGLGKTILSVEWAKRKDNVNTIIIVAPLNTVDTWTSTFNEQWPDMPVYELKSDPKHVASFGYLKQGKRGAYIIGWELMRTGALTGQHADLIIADETHKQANFNRSDQSILLREFTSRCKLALSGTPAANTPDGIFATINWLWPDRYKSRWKWINDFWRYRQNGAVFDLVRELTPNGVIDDLPMFTRRLRKNHRDDMQPVLPEIPISVELSPKQRKIYDRLSEEAGVWLGDEFMSTAIPLAQDIRLRQIALAVPTMTKDEYGFQHVSFAENATSSKIDKLIEVLETDEFSDQPFLVLTHSARIIPTVVAKLAKRGIKAYGFTGETKQGKLEGERRWLIDNLGKEYRVLVAGIQAIGEGTDGLQYVCHNMFWLSKHPNWLMNKQASMRLDRPGQPEPINVWYTYAEDTVDVRSLERLKEIEENLDEMLDNHA